MPDQAAAGNSEVTNQPNDEAKQKHLSKDGLKKDEAAGARTKRSSVRRKISERGDK